MKYGAFGAGTQGFFPDSAAAFDQLRWTRNVEPAGTTLVSRLNSHMSATSPPVATVHTAWSSSVSAHAGFVRGNGSVAASTSSWLAATVIWATMPFGSPAHAHTTA